MSLPPPLSLGFVLTSSRCTLRRAAGPPVASGRGRWAWCSGNSLRLEKKRRILNGLRRHTLVVLCCSDGVLPALRSNCTSIAATTEQSFCAFSCLYSLAPHKIRVSADGLFGGSPPKKSHPQNTPPKKENKGNRQKKRINPNNVSTFNPKFQPNSTPIMFQPQISAQFNPKRFHPQISTQFKPNFFSTQFRPQIIQQWTSNHRHTMKDEW